MKKKETKKTDDGKIVFHTEELKKNKSINEDTIKVFSFIILLVIVIGVFVVLYFVNGKYVTKDMDPTTTTTVTTEPIYDGTKTTVSDMFNISKKDTYYVLAYDSNDDIDGTYLYNLSKSFTNDKIKVYSLDLANAMNKGSYNKKGEANTKPSKASDVTFTTNTLIVFKKGKVVEYIQDKDSIVKKLTEKKNTSK